MDRSKVDVEAILSRTNLRAMIERDRGPANSSRKWTCPFHDDHNPSLGLHPDGRWWRCWSGRCGKHGNALDWVMLQEGLDFINAVKVLDPLAFPDRPEPTRKYRDLPPPAPAARVATNRDRWRDLAWQSEADRLVCQGERHLRGPEGADVRAYLAGRGIDMLTAERFRLGYFPEDTWSDPLEVLEREGRPRKIKACRGLSIPWLAPEAWYSAAEPTPGPRWVGCNVRRLGELEPGVGRYSAFQGSDRGFGYPWPDLDDSQIGLPAAIYEGELDALVSASRAGHLAHAFSIGGATQSGIRDETMVALTLCPWWLIAVDHDDAAIGSVDRWCGLAPHKARRILLPFGKDLTEYAVGGGDVAGWVAEQIQELEISPEAR